MTPKIKVRKFKLHRGRSAIGAIRCGSFVAVSVGYNTWKLSCDWLPKWEQTVECTRAKASQLVITLQAENRGVHVVDPLGKVAKLEGALKPGTKVRLLVRRKK